MNKLLSIILSLFFISLSVKAEVYIMKINDLQFETKTEELTAAKAHLAKKRKQSTADPKKMPTEKAEQESFEDILWALINTKEFLFNHWS